MAQVSSAFVKRQAGLINTLSKAARQSLLRELDGVTDRDVIIATMRRYGLAYTDISAALTARYYNQIRAQSRARGSFAAISQSGYDAGRMAGAAIAIIESVDAGTATVSANELLANALNREIKNAADNCIRNNCAQDPARPRYAIVPQGNACAFCQMRAANGYTYADEDAVESHDHCSCTATPVFRGDTIQGYRPEEYQAKYDEAKAALDNGDIPEELKEHISAEKAAKGKEYDRTKAILSVMRQQQGIS